jgi:hypothetical protein
MKSHLVHSQEIVERFLHLVERPTPTSVKEILGMITACDSPEDKAALVNARYGDGKTALHCAVEQYALEHMVLLIGYGAEIDPVWSFNDQTPLLMACEKGNLPAVILFVQLQARVVGPIDSDGYDALMLATTHGHVDVVRYLTEAFPEMVTRKRYYCQSTAHDMVERIVATPNMKPEKYAEIKKILASTSVIA